LLAEQGQIHFILAFLCLHSGSLDKALETQQKELNEQFPAFRQISRMDVAQGRYLARMTTQKSLTRLLGLVTSATVIVIALTGLQEVNARRCEIGIMIAMGVSHGFIIGLHLVRTLTLALLAALAGFLLGSTLAVQLTAPFLVVNTQPITILWQQFPAVACLTVAVAIVAEIAPTLKLLSLDPNTILAEQ
jgi:ABC-type lipoprotein release transport system permease subunit